jgi:hypothetical protein
MWRWKPFFHWSYSGVFIPVFWGTGIAMAAEATTYASLEWLFIPAYLFFLAGLVWSLGFWLTSDFLTSRSPRPMLRDLQNNVQLSTKQHRLWLMLPTAGIVIFFTLTFLGTYKVQKAVGQNRNIGVLSPANDPTPVHICDNVPPDASVVWVGANEDIVTSYPYRLLAAGNDQLMTLNKDKRDNLLLTVTIRGDNAKILAQFEDGVFTVNEHVAHFRHDDNTLSVDDEYGRNVLDVRYMNPRVIRIYGRFQTGDGTIVIDRKGFHLENTPTVVNIGPGSCMPNAPMIWPGVQLPPN